MDIVLEWLNDLAEIGGDVDAIEVELNRLGMAVDAVRTAGGSVPGVITARVTRTEGHPEAGHIHRVFLDSGDGGEHHVWCGAFNMQPGDVIPWATPGTHMPDGRVLAAKPILGFVSEGMCCSATELQLGDDHEGIMILPPQTPLGIPYGEALGLASHTVFEIDATRNRPESWGHLGVARDLAAGLKVAMKPRTTAVAPTGAPIPVAVEIVDGERCGRFTATVISGVQVGESPQWIKDRLSAAGMRPINNVVDASNYVMLELNQPNHAYDLATLGGGGFRIRCAAEGEQMTTLDGATRTLTTGDLLICDAHDVPIGIGGIMGGLDSEISDATTTVAFEVAWFEPGGIQATVGRLGLRSEASTRFERGVDCDGMGAAVARFAELLRETSPALVVHDGWSDARGAGLPSFDQSIELRLAYVNRMLGTNLAAADLPPLLDPIGLITTPGGTAATVSVRVPTWRPDITGEIEVIEEIARHFGYDNVGKRVPQNTSAAHGGLTPRQAGRRRLRQVLLGVGLTEAMPNPFLAPGDLDRCGLGATAVTITNPLVTEESILRTSLRPGLLKAVAYNASHRRPGAALFEIGSVFPPSDGQLPDEYEALGIALAGREAPAVVALWKELAAALSLGARVDQGTVPPGMHPGRSATLSVGRDVVGVVGEVHPDVTEAYGISERVAVLELNLTALLPKSPSPAKQKPVSRYPSSDLDFAFVTPDDVPAEKVERAVRQGGGALTADVQLFDVYRGAGVPTGARSLAYRLRLQAGDRTLTDADLAGVRDKVVAAATKLKATLRA